MRASLRVLSSVLATLILACGGTTVTRSNAQPDFAPDAQSTVAGEKLFRAHCQTCHSLPKAFSKTDDQWPALVLKYGRRAKLSSDQIQLITDYLIRTN